MEIKEKTEERKVRYQYLRTFDKHFFDREKKVTRRGCKPVVTICYIREDGVTRVGVSVCGPNDNFNYKRGRGLAYSRALHAERVEDNNISKSSIEYELIRGTRGFLYQRENKFLKEFPFPSFISDESDYLVTRNIEIS